MSLSCSSCLRFLRVPALHLPLKVRGPGKWRQLLPQAHLRASFEDSSSLLSEMSKRFKTTKTHVRNLQMSTAQLLAGIPRGQRVDRQCSSVAHFYYRMLRCRLRGHLCRLGKRLIADS